MLDHFSQSVYICESEENYLGKLPLVYFMRPTDLEELGAMRPFGRPPKLFPLSVALNPSKLVMHLWALGT